MRIVAGDVGGGFGMKARLYPETRAGAVGRARSIGRPVKWIGERTRGLPDRRPRPRQRLRRELALDEDGKFLALRVETLANIGAYLRPTACRPRRSMLGGLAGTYTTPAIYVDVTAVFTNTHPTRPYRGAGRPEASYCIERMIDIAAREMNIDRIELRRRNTIPPSAMPFKTGLVYTYDCGEFEKNMDQALELADWQGLRERAGRKRASAASSRLRPVQHHRARRRARALERRPRCASTAPAR